MARYEYAPFDYVTPPELSGGGRNPAPRGDHRCRTYRTFHGD